MRDAIYKFSAIVLLILMWQLVAFLAPERLLPSVFKIFEEFGVVILSSEFYHHLFLTLSRICFSVFISFVASIFVSVLSILNKDLRSFLSVFIQLNLNIPVVVMAYLIIILFGVSNFTPIFIVSLAVIPQLVILITTQLSNLNSKYFDLAKVYNLDRLTIIKDIIFPQISPYIYDALKLSISYSWKLSLLSETFLISSGIGYMINFKFNTFSIEEVIAWTLAFIIIMMIFEFVLLELIKSFFNKDKLRYD